MNRLENGPQPVGAGSSIEIFAESPWQMSYGERAALEGVLSQCKPKLAVEIGTAEGGSLERIARHSNEVHSFDLVEPIPQIRALPNVTFHSGDSHTLLPQVLDEFASTNRNVDFVLVDGDHSSEGVRRDIEDILNSPATRHTVILLHDTMNEVVRAGLDAVNYDAWPKVAYVELDFVPGYLFRQPGLFGEMWGGLGLVITSVGPKRSGRRAVQSRYFEAYRVFAQGSAAVLQEQTREQQRRELTEDIGEDSDALDDLAAQHERILAALRDLEAQHAELVGAWERTMNSFSWRITRPLRDLKFRIKRLMA